MSNLTEDVICLQKQFFHMFSARKCNKTVVSGGKSVTEDGFTVCPTDKSGNSLVDDNFTCFILNDQFDLNFTLNGNLTFDQALIAMRDGYKVKRSGWEFPTYIKSMDTGMDICIDNKGKEESYTLATVDLLATDWEIVI